MLIEFSVKNFMSFKNKITLSMEKGNGDENLDNIFKWKDTELVKVASIYGANASGKSNLLKAFYCAILMVRNSSMISINGKWLFIKPFMFDDVSSKEPSEFEFIILSSGVKYKYYFSTDGYKVYDEGLDAYYTQKPTSIFKRYGVNKYVFNADKAKLEPLTAHNTDNKLFLSTATTWNYDKTKDVFLWFNNVIDTYDSFDMISNRDIISYKNNDNNIKQFALKLLKESDILINNIYVDYKEDETDKQVMEMFDAPLIKNVDIQVEHEIIDENNNKRIYRLSFDEESRGTRVLFALAPFLKRAFESEKVIIVDELEKSLHPALIECIVKLFNNKDINKVNSQLIFTTHATNLLNIDILRRDQIWFTEKNPNNGVSSLYPLDSFSVRKDENIYKGYLGGRYGAVPFIRDTDLWLEDK